MFGSTTGLHYAILLVAVGLILGLIFAYYRRQMRALSALAESVDGKRHGSGFVARFESGVFRCRFTFGSRHRAPSFTISRHASSSFRALIYKPNRLMRLLRRSRSAGEPGIAAADFGHDLALRTPQPEALRTVLGDRHSRQAIDRLFDAGWSVLELAPTHARLSLTPVSLGRDMSPDKLRATFQLMNELADRLPAMNAGEARKQLRRMEESSTATFLIGLGVLLVTAVLSWGAGWILYAPVRPWSMLAASLPITALLLVPIFLWMRRRLRGDMYRLGQSIYLVVALFLTVLVHGGTMIVNGALDAEAPRIYQDIEIRSMDRGKFPARASVDAWNGTGTARINIASTVANQLARQHPQRATIAVRSGALGYEWVEWVRANS